MTDPTMVWGLANNVRGFTTNNTDAGQDPTSVSTFMFSVYAPAVFADPEGSPDPFTNPQDIVDYFASQSVAYQSTYLPQVGTISRVSYPSIYAGPVSYYLPDVRPSYTEYPYTVQAYTCRCTVTLTDPSAAPIDCLFIIQSGLPSTEVIPPPLEPPDPVTIQLKRDVTISRFSIKPSDASILAKYAAPVQFIRAKFDTTRVAVITPTIVGGFMVYEEVAGVPISPVYIYTAKRKILHVVDASLIDQYRLYTF
jgi:hypothetical protein